MRENSFKPFAILFIIFLFGALLSFNQWLSPPALIKRKLSRTKYKTLAPLIIQLSKLETGRYTSRLFIQQNNLFGMKNPSIRPTVGRSIPGNDFRAYDSIGQSVQDFILWLDYTGFPADLNPSYPSDFISELKARQYFEEPYEEYLKLYLAIQ